MNRQKDTIDKISVIVNGIEGKMWVPMISKWHEDLHLYENTLTETICRIKWIDDIRCRFRVAWCRPSCKSMRHWRNEQKENRQRWRKRSAPSTFPVTNADGIFFQKNSMSHRISFCISDIHKGDGFVTVEDFCSFLRYESRYTARSTSIAISFAYALPFSLDVGPDDIIDPFLSSCFYIRDGWWRNLWINKTQKNIAKKPVDDSRLLLSHASKGVGRFANLARTNWCVISYAEKRRESFSFFFTLVFCFFSLCRIFFFFFFVCVCVTVCFTW